MERIVERQKSNRKLLFFVGLIVSVTVANLVIYLTEPIEKKIVQTNWILIINSSIATGLCLFLVSIRLLKFKKIDHQTRIYISIAIGLALWLCANIQWFEYEEEGIVPEIPSYADFLWISAYPFFGYALYSEFRLLYKKHRNKKILFITVCCSILLVAYISYVAINLSVLSSPRGIVLLSIVILYPILNVILIVPAIVMLACIKTEKELSIPRMLESISLISLVMADSWFTVIYLSNIIEAIWYSNFLIVNHYLIIAAGLLWSILFLNSDYQVFSKIKNWASHKYNSTKILLVAATIITLTSLLLFPFFDEMISSNSNTDTMPNLSLPNNFSEIHIGVLLGLSGSSYESGVTQKAVLMRAVEEINNNFSMSNLNKRIILDIEDTEIKPDLALAKTKELVDKGIRIIIGPQTSAELKKIKDYIDEHNVILISHSSTAPSLSIKDNIFRLLQNDNNQGKYIAKKIFDEGIRLVIPLWRDDQYGNELYNVTKTSFEELGGIFDSGITYDPHLGKFAGSLNRINFITWDQKLKDLGLEIEKTKNLYNIDSSKIGIFVISFGELVPILLQSPSHEVLDEVKWYGSEATAKNERLMKHSAAVEFAGKTNLTSPMFRIDNENKIFESLEKSLEMGLNTNDANIYDALWIAALTENISTNTSFSLLKDNLNKTFSSYNGASGGIQLDVYGDRIGDYDFWTVKANPINKDKYEWIRLNE